MSVQLPDVHARDIPCIPMVTAKKEKEKRKKSNWQNLITLKSILHMTQNVLIAYKKFNFKHIFDNFPWSVYHQR